MRMRVTVRGEGTEIRGYATMEALASLTSPPGEQPYMVIASPAEDDFDPFGISQPEHPPTVDMSLEIIHAMWENKESNEDFILRMAQMHFAQSTVIRGERGRAERAEKELFQARNNHADLARKYSARAELIGELRTENERLKADHTESEKTLIDTVNKQADVIERALAVLDMDARSSIQVVAAKEVLTGGDEYRSMFESDVANG